MTTNTAQQQQQQPDDDNDVYRYLVIDSGPIIRVSLSNSSLWRKAAAYYTVPAVLQEIRDAKARQHLEEQLLLLPSSIQTRQPSAQGIQAVVEFSRLTGDYHSLSSVDIQVLGLLYDLEREANMAAGGDMSHVRLSPKRPLGQKIQMMSKKTNEKECSSSTSKNQHPSCAEESNGQPHSEHELSYDIVEEDDSSVEEKSDVEPNEVAKEGDIVVGHTEVSIEAVKSNETAPCSSPPKTWAMLVNPTSTASLVATTTAVVAPPTAQPKNIDASTAATISFSEQAATTAFGQMKICTSSSSTLPKQDTTPDGGQFSDASEDGSHDDNDYYYAYDPNKDISDEECDVYIRDPDELQPPTDTANSMSLPEDLQQCDFPCLAAANLVPYEKPSDNDTVKCRNDYSSKDRPLDQERKLQSLQPLSKSGKLYNSFRNYGDLLKQSKPTNKNNNHKLSRDEQANDQAKPVGVESVHPEQNEQNKKKNESRIMGGMTVAGQDIDVQDDGEGWITCTKDIESIKAVGGTLEPQTTRPKSSSNNHHRRERPRGPPNRQRAACATTDFAMQNVILQMNLALLSVDGLQIRQLKSWVTRCGACFKVYTTHSETKPQKHHALLEKRLFCERCGSDMMQRVAASVNGQTGRLRLHFSKKHHHNLRGTKYSLPKPGTGNRFQGDLLLREDQLLMGAWQQKVKMRSGGKAKSAAQSMFGRDIASNVGCHAHSLNLDDIRVGFGRRNPNAVKGRERRGKKKKSSDKACGLRRY